MFVYIYAHHIYIYIHIIGLRRRVPRRAPRATGLCAMIIIRKIIIMIIHITILIIIIILIQIIIAIITNNNDNSSNHNHNTGPLCSLHVPGAAPLRLRWLSCCFPSAVLVLHYPFTVLSYYVVSYYVLSYSLFFCILLFCFYPCILLAASAANHRALGSPDEVTRSVI